MKLATKEANELFQYLPGKYRLLIPISFRLELKVEKIMQIKNHSFLFPFPLNLKYKSL